MLSSIHRINNVSFEAVKIDGNTHKEELRIYHGRFVGCVNSPDGTRDPAYNNLDHG